MSQPNRIRQSSVPGLALGDVSNNDALPAPSPARGEALDAGGGPPLTVAAGTPNVTAFGALNLTADQLPYATGPAALALTSLTAFIRTLLGAVAASAARTTLGTPTFAPESTVTSLPGSPVDGQEIYYLADATNGIVWHLKYRAASASASKWEVVGGSDLFAEVATAESTASGAYAALTTAGPSITVPLAGDYEVRHGCRPNATSATWQGTMSYDIGATGAVDADMLRFIGAGTAGGAGGSITRRRRKTGLAASTALVPKYKTDTSTVTFQERWMAARPVRVG